MTNRATNQETGSRARAYSERGSDELRARQASEVLAILEAPVAKPANRVPLGFWKTGWLPGPQEAA